MRYVITPSQIHFFRTNGYIAFDSLTTVTGSFEECAKHTSFLARQNTFQTPEKYPITKKISCSRKLGNVARELVGEKHLRLLFNQVFLPNDTLPKELQKPSLLSDISSFQGLSILLLLCLEKNETKEDKTSLLDGVPIPQEKGSGVFFHPEVPLDFRTILDDSFLLLAYGKLTTIYNQNSLDPFLEEAKKQGRYQQGSQVSNSICPLLF